MFEKQLLILSSLLGKRSLQEETTLTIENTTEPRTIRRIVKRFKIADHQFVEIESNMCPDESGSTLSTESGNNDDIAMAPCSDE